MICAQTDIINSPFLISSSGGEWVTDNYNLCFSVGEIAIDTHIPQDIILTQGFHQESNYQITTLRPTLEKYKIMIYPNPSRDVIYLNSDLNNDVDVNLKDAKGRVVYRQLNIKINNNYSLDLRNLTSGVYFLEILITKNQKQVYQIQKLN
tara:strand:- start:114 stop:563 length:450 start_codon:yes stop_codon:yes gene_type:complete